MDPLEFHPLANIFPLMTDDEIEVLGEDMLKHGQLKRIMRYEGKILDGRNRYRACLLKGIEPRLVDYHGPDPLGLVISLNLKRRHLDDGQRAMIAASLATMKQGARTDLSPNCGMSQSKAAELLNVNKRRVERAREVVDHGVPDLVDAVKRGDVKVSAAAEFAKETPPLEQQRQIVEHGAPAAAVKATVKAKADRAAHKTPKPKPDVAPAADRAERTPAAKAAASSLIDVIEEWGRANVSAVVLARMSNDERTELMRQIAQANAWLNKAANDIAGSGGANLGVLAPPNLRYEALTFLHKAAARIEAEMAGRPGRESSS